jgi:hypothetical protein
MVNNALASFGSGRLFITNTDLTLPPPQPIELGVLQGVDLDFSFTTKPIYGANQFAVFVARAEAKWTLKAKMGVMSGTALNAFFFGLTTSTGQIALATDIAGTIPTSTPFTLTPTVPNSGTWVADQGIKYALSGIPLDAVTGTPTTGQYEVTAGVYTFAAADEGLAVVFAFTYTYSGVGQKIALTNQILGTTPFFSGVFRNRDARSGLFNTLILNRMTSSKLSISSKTSDYAIPDFDCEIMDDGTGNIGTMSFGDTS